MPNSDSNLDKIKAESTEDGDGSLQSEQAFLQEQARSANLRNVVAHKVLVSAFQERINVLQTKLDLTESSLGSKTHRVAELEQAERSFKVQSVVELIGITGGAFLLSISSFSDGVEYKYMLIGMGLAATAMGILAKSLLTIVWLAPKARTLSKYPCAGSNQNETLPNSGSRPFSRFPVSQVSSLVWQGCEDVEAAPACRGFRVGWGVSRGSSLSVSGSLKCMRDKRLRRGVLFFSGGRQFASLVLAGKVLL